jgi:hypothetical protein
MSTLGPLDVALLFARQGTGPQMTRSLAAMRPTRHRLPARQSTTEVVLVAGNGGALLVLAVTPPLAQDSTRGARPRVARMVHFVAARALPRAGVVARGRLGAARNGGIQHVGAALAVQLLEAGLHARGTTAAVASAVTPVVAAGQKVVAREGTHVFDFDATALVAAVLAAEALLGALLLATGVVRFRGDLFAGQFAVHVAASAPDQGGLGARGAGALVARVLAGMGRGRLAALQQLCAHLITAWYRIQTRLPHILQLRPPARTRSDQIHIPRTRLARPFVTNLLAFVIPASETLPADLFARVTLRPHELPCTIHLPADLAAETLLPQRLAARHAQTGVTLRMTLVQAALQFLVADRVADDLSV